MYTAKFLFTALLVACAPIAIANPNQPDINIQTIGFYSMLHPEVKQLTQNNFNKNFPADYANLFKQNPNVSKQQFIAYSNQHLENIISKRREGSLKQAHVRFNVLNSNKDDKITLNEFQAIGLKTFAGFDKNQDGIINAEDIKLAPQQQGTHDGLRITTPLAMPMANNIQEFIQTYGQTKNYVTLANYLTERDKQFFAVDQNQDFVLSEQEYVNEFMQRYDQNLTQARQQYQIIFAQQFDAIAKNKSTINAKHLNQYAVAVFKSLDRNKNGILDPSEI
ncbi:EF-hand domain-containing protein [Acinetobacter qingfengensis]|uniref:EF-hand domain-containing protein n=1 Tax=Acinetobacter qingfengensis TaxID=1262585 RepID=A0A1E7R2P1_9GAMM|nr:hypothetical protein [Acinetobacter qingfengensis]OEY93584.1 hypothetical protein BJI46_14175 [Acinetobacter qingfengensis]